MSTAENRPARRHVGEPTAPGALPQELAEFLREQDIAAVFHGSDNGTLLVVKTPTVELETLGGTYPISLDHQVWAHPASPVIRSLITFYDRPDAPLRLETFTNIADLDQRADFAALGEQPDLAILLYDETLHHRLTKRLTNRTAEHVPMIVAEAERLLAAIPAERFDFDIAKAAVMKVARL
jgi:hypothetical protein